MKHYCILILCIFSFGFLSADPCVFPEELNFTTQAQVNAFIVDNPDCTEIDGSIYVNGSNITNLNGLANITSVTGSFQVVSCPMLSSLTGLSNLDSVGGTFRLSGLVVASLNGLQNLRHVRSCAIDLNHALTSLNGLSGLEIITNTFRVWQNNNLLTLDGINSLVIADFLDIHDNAKLFNLNGLANLDTAYLETAYVYMNPNLTFCGASAICAFLSDPSNEFEFENNASGCNTVEEIQNSCDGCPGGDVTINSQADLVEFMINYPSCTMIDGSVSIFGSNIQDLSAFSNIVSIGGSLDLLSSPMITDLDGLQNLTSVGSFFRISSIPVPDVDELSNLTSVGTLAIDLNQQLTNLDGLQNLTSITNTLRIWQNAVLTDLTGLSSLSNVRIIEIDQNTLLATLDGLQNVDATQVEFFTIRWCPNLSVCAIESVCASLNINEDGTSIHDNNTGCDSNEEVALICAENCLFIPDTDGDGLCDDMDNCLSVSNPMQEDEDEDGEGDHCDCDDGMQGGNEEGIDCGGACNPCSPPNAVCGVMTVYVNPSTPDRNGPGTQDIWNIAAMELDAGSTSSSVTPAFQVKRNLSNLTFDWTTNGSCIDVIANGGALSNMDKGTVYRDCYPATTADFNKNKLYKLRIEDEFGSDECSGTLKVIANSAGIHQAPVIHFVIPNEEDIQVNREFIGSSDADVNLSLQQVMVAPNPGADHLFVSWISQKSEVVSIHVTDLAGRVFLYHDFNSISGENMVTFDISEASGGLYVVSIKTANALVSKKWLKSR